MIGTPVALHALTLYLRSDKARLALARLLVTASIAALPVMSLWGLFNFIWTGNPLTNTYTLQWPYDKVGFGEGSGLNPGGHSFYWAWRNARADLTFWMRDTFGFTLSQETADYLKTHWGYQAGVGLAWLFVLMGLLYGRKMPQVWWMFSFFVAIVVGGLFYWIGSAVHGGAVYSVRYYYEAIFGACLVAAYGFVALAGDLGKHGPKIVYIGLALACIASVVAIRLRGCASHCPANGSTDCTALTALRRRSLPKSRRCVSSMPPRHTKKCCWSFCARKQATLTIGAITVRRWRRPARSSIAIS